MKISTDLMEQSLKHLRVADVELFITAARLQSLGKSASLHHLSQSAASAAILRVEEAFGMPLCTHEKRQFCLTREGVILLPRLEYWLKGLRDLMISSSPIPLRIAMTHALAQIAVPALLTLEAIDFQHMRPDAAYGAVLHGQADMALVLDNAHWKGVAAQALAEGAFQLYAKGKEIPAQPVLLPEEQIEVLFLQENWLKIHGKALPIKSRIPSWSLIAQICAEAQEVGFLPDFLGRRFGLHPVAWQPAPSSYQILAIYRREALPERFEPCFTLLRKAFM